MDGMNLNKETRWHNGNVPDCHPGFESGPTQVTTKSLVSPEMGFHLEWHCIYCGLASEGRQRYEKMHIGYRS